MEIDRSRRLFVEARVLGIGHHADDLVRLLLPIELEPPAERGAVAKVVLRKGLVHDRDARAPFVLDLEIPPGQPGRAERLEELRRDPVD